MRILWINRIESNLGYNSLVITATQLAKAMLDLDPLATVAFPVHENFSDKKWLLNYSFEPADLERAEVWPLSKDIVGRTPATRRLGYLSGPAFFNRLKPLSSECQFIDAIVVDGAPAIIPAVRVATTPTYLQGYSREIPVISYESWTPTGRWKSSVFGVFDAPACLMGSLYADYVYYQSQWCFDDHLDDYRRLFQPSVVSKLLDKLEVGNTGVWADKLPWKQYDGRKPTILWSGYVGEDFQQAKDAMFTAFRAGMAEKLVFHFMDSSAKSEIVEKSKKLLPDSPNVIRVCEDMPQAKYLEFVLQADLVVGLGNVLNQYGGRFVEMVSMGLPLVTNHIYARILTPPGETYPFLVSSPSELTGTLISASAAIQAVPTIGREFGAKVREYHDVRKTSAKMYAKMQELVTAGVAGLNLGGLEPEIASIIQNECPLTHAEFVARLEKRMAKPQDLRKNPIFPPGVLRWAALKQGAVDIGGIGQPVYQYGN